MTNVATNTTLNAKINEVKNKIPRIINLASTTALTAIKNKIPKGSNLVKKTDYTTKISETEVNIRKFYRKIGTNKFSKQQ